MATFNGTEGNDTLIGGAAADDLNGFGGNDFLQGGDGTDTVLGGAGNDTMSGNGGNDWVRGGTGNDTVSGGSGQDSFVFADFGTTNADTVNDFASNWDNLQLDLAAFGALGAAGRFAAGDVRFYAAAGATGGRDADDRVVYNTTTGQLFYDADGSGSGAAQLIATLANRGAVSATDIYVFGTATPPPPPSGQTLNGTSGNDTLTGGAGNDTLDGLQGNDRLIGSGGGDTFKFDVPVTPENADTIADFASAADKLQLDASVMTALGASGSFSAGDARFYAADFGGYPGYGHDATDRILYDTSTGKLWYDPDGSTIGESWAGAWPQLIATLEGAPPLAATDIAVVNGSTSAGTAADGTDGNDSLRGTAGDDTLAGGTGNDTLDGLAGHDVLDGSEGSDSMLGGEGNDTLYGGYASYEAEGVDLDTMDGGLGDDRYVLERQLTISEWYDNSSEVTLRDSGGVDTIVARSGYWTLAPEFENLELVNGYGEGGMLGVGNAGDNVIVAHTSWYVSATLDGAGGNDRLIGGDGRDTFRFRDGYGNDTVEGAGDEDTLDFSGLSTGITVDFRSGTASGGGGTVSFAGVDQAMGTVLADLLIAPDRIVDHRYGDALGPILQGNGGNDTLIGGSEGDSLHGDDYPWQYASPLTGDDRLEGRGGADLLYGGAGSDWLDGGAGNDALNGGDGADRFAFAAAPRADNADSVADFSSGTDRVLLDRAVFFNLGAAGDFAAGDARFFAAAGAISGQAPEHRVVYDTSTGKLYYDADGSGVGAAHPIATLEGAPALAASAITAYGDAGTPPPSSSITGTNGNDSLAGTEGADTIDGLAGNDTLDGRGGDDVLVGGAGNDSLLGASGYDSLRGGDGADTLDGGDGVDTLDGGLGNDTYLATAGDVIVDAGGVDHVLATMDWTLGDGLENLTIEIGETYASGTGNTLDNDLRGTGDDIRLFGLGGNDRIQAQSRWSMLEGGDGNDTVIGSSGFDNIFGDAGDDVLDDRPDDASQESAGANFAGGAGNDTIFGGASNDLVQLSPGYGDDTIDGGAGRDSISFEQAQSAVVASLQAGSASGGGAGGAGTVLVSSVENVYGGRLSDRITGDGADNRLSGHSYFFYAPPEGASDGNDTLDGLAGNDTLVGGYDADNFMFSVAPGAANADTIADFASGADKIVLDGTVHANSGASGNFLAADPRFHSAAGASAGRDADDRVVYNSTTGELWYDADGSGSGVAQLVALLGTGRALAATDIVVVNGSGSSGTTDGTNGNDSIVGTTGNDTMNGLGGDDTLRGLEGNDFLHGGIGADSMDGGLGNDTFYVGQEGDVVSDAGGTDTVWSEVSYDLGLDIENLRVLGTAATSSQGNNLDNRMEGNDAANYFNARAGNDTLLGNGGDDYFDMSTGGTSSPGNDSIDGGAGIDSVDYDGYARSSLAIDLSAGTATGGGDGGIGGATLASIERLIGGGFADTIRGAAAAEYLDGRAGNDTLEGRGDNDTLLGGTGADSFIFSEAPGAASADRLEDFASGTDKIRLDALDMPALGTSGNFGSGDARFWAAPGANAGHDADDRVVFNTTTGELWYDADGSGAGSAQLIATVVGSVAATDIIVDNGTAPPPPPAEGTNGTEGNDTMFGGTGSDTLNGLGGNDVMQGGGGTDTLRGGAGNDTMSGNDGADWLEGGTGNERLSGGSGQDAFVFREFGAANADTLTDFAGNNWDSLRLDNAVFTALGADGRFVSGDGRFWSAAGATAGHDVDDRIVYNTSTGQLYYDADGSGAGAAQLLATLPAGAVLVATDLWII